MPIIRNRTIVEDDFRTLGAEDPITDGDIIISLERFRAEHDALEKRAGRLGVEIPNNIFADEVLGELETVDLIAIDFPIYRDGRGFSTARLLRRGGFTGELRATGNVLRDQIAFMERCGPDVPAELKGTVA
ncbi:MAG: DUF934 domain-containing protein, partial [Candidatus Binatia bacterium]|nr:DUF934 domain-containing protein [Candidatus Binatia bacterium]